MNRLICPHDFRKGGARRQLRTAGLPPNFLQDAERNYHRRVDPATAHPPLPPELRGQSRTMRFSRRPHFFADVSRRSIRLRTRRHFPCSKGFELRHARCSSLKATSSALPPCRASISAASESISARGIRRGRTVPSQSTQRSTPQNGLVIAPMTIHPSACLRVSMRPACVDAGSAII
jgi:hypothetical protein